jgi:hypothetical protein
MHGPLRARWSRWRMVALIVTVSMGSAIPCHGRPLVPECPVGVFSLRDSEQDSTSDAQLKVKSPTGALIRSGVVPGWGQLYNEQYVKCGLVFLTEGILIAGAVVEHLRAGDDRQELDDPLSSDQEREAAWLRYSRRIDKRNTYLWYLAGVKFVSMVDAYVDAHLYRFEEGPFTLDMHVRSERDGAVMVVGFTMR